MVAAAQGHPVRAARLFGAEEKLREAIGFSRQGFYRTAHERSVADTRAELSDRAFEVARAEGQAMSLDAAVTYALGESILTEKPG